MHVDGAGIAGEGVAPDALEQLVTREDEPAVVEQLPEKIELLRRELDLLIADVDLAAAGVDMEVAVANLRGFRSRTSRRRPPQDRLHPSDELTRVEGLGHVVVGPDLEPDDLVDVLVTCCQHQDRDVTALPDPSADIHPVHVRKHQVEDDQRGLFHLYLRQRVPAGAHRLDPVARVLQVKRDEGCNRDLVLDHQHSLGLRHSHGLSIPPDYPTEGAARVSVVAKSGKDL